MTIVIRILLTAVLVWLIYGEAGTATAIFAGLVALALEANAVTLRIHRDRLDAQIDRIRALTHGRPR